MTTPKDNPPSRNEIIKTGSGYLRGTLVDGIADASTGSISEDDQQLVKFHGMYQQDDRDLRGERVRKKMEPAYSFMIRLRLPGGICTPEQWLMLDRIASDYGNGTIRLTTRQTFQFHGIIKANLKATLRRIDAALLDTLAACGDVNRTVMASPNPAQSKAHRRAYELARRISDRFVPQTSAYREIWLDGEKISGGEIEEEPVYGKTYLPRKFKTGIAVPPDNDIDVFSQDLGFIAVLDETGDVKGWNVVVGGGMGMTHGDTKTYPRLAENLGFCGREEAEAVTEAVITIQRDWGDRSNRRHARLKYTIEDHGIDAFRAEVERRLGKGLKEPQPFAFTSTGDRYGWVHGENGRMHLSLFIENGRIADFDGERRLREGLRAIAACHDGEFRLTGNQNLIVANVAPSRRDAIDRLISEYGLTARATALRRNAMACVSLPTCGLALAESERYLPLLVTKLENLLAGHGLGSEEIVIRMTGCPNGCARPFLAEIGLVGKKPDHYNLYLGAAFDGSRLSKLYASDLDEDGIIACLDPLFTAYAAERRPKEHFGDFLIRGGMIAPTLSGKTFHADTGPGPNAPLLREGIQ